MPRRLSILARKALRAVNLDLFEPVEHPPPAPVTFHTRIAEVTQKDRETAARFEMPARQDGLPSIEELNRRYDIFNWLHFGGNLPAVRIEYSNRMLAAGLCDRRNNVIRLGHKYHELFPEEIDDTLKHEMIHLLYPRHDRKFKDMAARIGASVRARGHPELRKPPRYIYICPGCGQEYPRQKRVVMASCGSCSKGGRFDPRYKLKLHSSLRSKSPQ